LPKVLNYDKVCQLYEETIYRCCEGDEWLMNHKPKISIYQAGGPFEMDLDHPIVSVFKNSFQTATGKEPVINGVPIGCDSRVWKNIANCPTLQYGPGNLGQCHSINEYIDLKSYLEAILIYAQLILDWGRNTD
jgi:acetylornithine deacetylase